jgi:hypothetical protein
LLLRASWTPPGGSMKGPCSLLFRLAVTFALKSAILTPGQPSTSVHSSSHLNGLSPGMNHAATNSISTAVMAMSSVTCSRWP